jgi:O-antigen/teichoic acid export membrane protein
MSVSARDLIQVFRGELLQALFWKLVNAAGLQGAVLLSTVVVARLVGLESFGAYSLVATTVMSVAAVAQAGAALSATKFVGEHLHGNPQQVAKVLAMCRIVTWALAVLVAVAMAAAAPWLADRVLGNPQLEVYLRWAGIAAACQTIALFHNGALEGFGAFRAVGRVGLASGVLHLLATGLGAWAWGLDGAVGGFVAAMLARVLLYGRALAITQQEHAIPPPASLTQADWRTLLAFTLPAGLASLVTLPCVWLVAALVARQPGGLAMVGLFMAAQQVRLVVVQVPIMLNSVSFSVLSRLKGQGRGGDFGSVFWSNMAAGAALSVATVAVMAALSGAVLHAFGPAFTEGRLALLILLASVVPEILALSAYQLVQSSGRMWRSLLLIVGPRDLLYLALAALWLPSHGVAGAAAAYLSAQLFSLMSTLLVGRGALSNTHRRSVDNAL